MTLLTENTKVIYSWIVRSKEPNFSPSDAKQAYPSRFSDDPTAFGNVITALTKRNIIGPEIKTPTKGRPSIIHQVNPAVFAEQEGE